MEWLDKSGIVGYILAGISIVTLGIFLERLFVIHRERLRVRKGAGIMARIATLIADNTHLGRHRLEDLVTYAADEEMESLGSGVGLLRLAYSVSPLLGLLGTVLGMIEAFKEVAMLGGAVKPAVLASGIWVALLTTAEGLIVAIIAFLMYHFLQFQIVRVGKMVEKNAEYSILGVKNGTAEPQQEG